MHIKVRMLLPREIDEKGEEIDPRTDLVKALIEYKKYKEMAEELSFFETYQRKLNFRSNFSYDEAESPAELDVLLKNISVFDLAKAFKSAIEGLKEQPVHEIKKINVTIDEQIEFIIKMTQETKSLHFLTLINEMREKIRIVITFVALLELVRAGRIKIKSSSDFNDFVINLVDDGKHIHTGN